MLDLNILPERSVGTEVWEFILGMTLSQAIQVIKSQDVVVKGVQLCYNDQSPLANDLIINLTQDGIRLVFDSILQRLKIIEIYNMTRVKLKYCGSSFNSPDTPPTIAQIDQSFGATHPAVYVSDRQLLVLNFRGLSFQFKVDSRFEPQYARGIKSLQFPAGSSPVVARMFIYSGNSLPQARPPALPTSCFQGNCFLDKLEVVRDRDRTVLLRFYILAETGNSWTHQSSQQPISCVKTVTFGDTCQDVLASVGCPVKVFYKDEDKMRIHSSDAQRQSLTRRRRSDFFFNYFTLGVDILFDGNTQRVKKFVLHSNFPGHYNFNVYHRCNFHIPMTTSKCHGGAAGSSDSKIAAVTDETKDVNICHISFDTKWDALEKLLLADGVKPVVLTRSSVNDTVNPFGSTFCYGVQDVIFEVTSNHHIASVILYQPLLAVPAIDSPSSKRSSVA